MAGYRRTPEMTEQLVDAVRKALEAHPEQRMGQIISNYIISDHGMFNLYDEALLHGFREAAGVPGYPGKRLLGRGSEKS